MLTQQEVAEIMTSRGFPMTRARVHQIEQRALAKLRKDASLRRIAGEFDCAVTANADEQSRDPSRQAASMAQKATIVRLLHRQVFDAQQTSDREAVVAALARLRRTTRRGPSSKVIRMAEEYTDQQ